MERPSIKILAAAAAIFFAVTAGANAINIGSSAKVVALPNTPTNLSAAAPAYNQVLLSWTNNSPEADVFTIERRVEAGSYSQIDITPGTVAVYTDNAVNAATTYYYRVRSFIGNGYSSYSNEASTTTPNQPVPPIPGGGGSGGGGGGGGTVNPNTNPPPVILPLPTHPIPSPAVLNKIDGNRDGRLNIVDLSVMLYYFGEKIPPYTHGDANGDGVINIVDVSILLYYWTG